MEEVLIFGNNILVGDSTYMLLPVSGILISSKYNRTIERRMVFSPVPAISAPLANVYGKR